MKDILFILNPIAGGGLALELEELIHKEMKGKCINYKLKLTEGPRDAIKLAEEGIREGSNIIVAVGGDGTINEIAQILVNTDIPIGIIPGGSGNDLARSLGLPLDPKAALDNILNNEKSKIDIGYVNGELFLNIASTGLDAAVVKGAKKYKVKYKGNMAYTISLIENLIKFKKKEIEIEIDGKVIKEKAYLVAVGNGKTYGGGFNVLPMAELDDGYFHICIVKKATKLALLIVFPSILFSKHTVFKRYVSIYKGKKVKITTKEELYLNVDGELLDLPEETNFEINQRRLNIIY